MVQHNLSQSKQSHFRSSGRLQMQIWDKRLGRADSLTALPFTLACHFP